MPYVLFDFHQNLICLYVSTFDQLEPAADSTEGLVWGNRQLEDFPDVASMANLSHVYRTEEGEWDACGELTEIAIHVFASKFDWNPIYICS